MRPRHEICQRAFVETIEQVNCRCSLCRNKRSRSEIEESCLESASPVERDPGECQGAGSDDDERSGLESPTNAVEAESSGAGLRSGDHLALLPGKVGESAVGIVHVASLTGRCHIKS